MAAGTCLERHASPLPPLSTFRAGPERAGLAMAVWIRGWGRAGAKGPKRLIERKENKAARVPARPGCLTSQTTAPDSLRRPCQVELLPRSHPFGARAVRRHYWLS